MSSSQATAKSYSDEDLKKYYDAHKAQFQQEEMVKASHILIKVEKRIISPEERKDVTLGNSFEP